MKIYENMRGSMSNTKIAISKQLAFVQPCPLSNAAQEVLMQKFRSVELMKEPSLCYVARSKKSPKPNQTPEQILKFSSFFSSRQEAIAHKRKLTVLGNIRTAMFHPCESFAKYPTALTVPSSIEKERSKYEGNKYAPPVHCLTLDLNKEFGETTKNIFPTINQRRSMSHVKLKGFSKSPIKDKMGYVLGKLTNPTSSKEHSIESLTLSKLSAHKTKHSKSGLLKPVMKPYSYFHGIENDYKTNPNWKDFLPNPGELTHKASDSAESFEIKQK